jgi:hypothetical protein
MPYDKALIMEHGNRGDSVISFDPGESEVPEEPWPDEVYIRIKSGTPPRVKKQPFQSASDGDGTASSHPGSDPSTRASQASGKTWKNATPGPSFVGDVDTTALASYQSGNVTQFSAIPDDPLVLAQLEADLAVHKAISWATRKNYEIHMGISLAVPNPAG